MENALVRQEFFELRQQRRDELERTSFGHRLSSAALTETGAMPRTIEPSVRFIRIASVIT